MDRAAAEAFARPRSRLRWLDASTTLEDFALVTFDVDPDRLTAVLPAGLSPEVRTLDDGRARGFRAAALLPRGAAARRARKRRPASLDALQAPANLRQSSR